MVLINFDELAKKFNTITAEKLMRNDLSGVKFELDDNHTNYFVMYSDLLGISLGFYEGNKKLSIIEIDVLSNGEIMLPEPFLVTMNNSQVHDALGNPVKSYPPESFGPIQTGGFDHYYWKDNKQISLLVHYEYETKEITAITIKPTSDLEFI